ncbi:MAG: Phosphocarrier protein HPr [Chlamydiia bacterium]|nr:Phosphocarrier protein HPr [Chlamydiia bacterium]
MEQQKVTEVITVLNESGLHTRPSTEIVKLASTFKAKVTIYAGNISVNGKSLLGILMLAAARGAKLRIEAEGEDARECVDALVDLAEKKFLIDY